MVETLAVVEVDALTKLMCVDSLTLQWWTLCLSLAIWKVFSFSLTRYLYEEFVIIFKLVGLSSKLI